MAEESFVTPASKKHKSGRSARRAARAEAANNVVTGNGENAGSGVAMKNADMEGPTRCVVIATSADAFSSSNLRAGRKLAINRMGMVIKDMANLWFPKFRYESRIVDTFRLTSPTVSGTAATYENYFNTDANFTTWHSFGVTNQVPTVTNGGAWAGQTARDRLFVTKNVVTYEFYNPSDRVIMLYYALYRAKEPHSTTLGTCWSENLQRRQAYTGSGTTPGLSSVYEWGLSGLSTSHLWDCKQTWTKITIHPGAQHTLNIDMGQQYMPGESVYAGTLAHTYNKGTFGLYIKAVGQNVIDGSISSNKMTTCQVNIDMHARQITEYTVFKQYQNLMTRWMADNQISQAIAATDQSAGLMESDQVDAGLTLPG